MGILTIPLKTHQKDNLTSSFFESLNICKKHGIKPQIFDIVAGKQKEHHFVASCKHEDCNKISSESAEDVVKFGIYLTKKILAML